MGLPDCLDGCCHLAQEARDAAARCGCARKPPQVKWDNICNFCYKTPEEADLIITNGEVGICSDCIFLCVEVVFKGGLNRKGIKQNQNPFQEITPNET